MKQWFQNLKVAHKLMLIGIFFVIPDSVMFYYFITGINANIEFARMEKRGIEYQRPLEDLLEYIPQHGAMARDLGAQSAETNRELAKKRAQIDDAFENLAAVDARIGDKLQFTDEGLAKRKREHYRASVLRQEWTALKKRLSTLSPEERAGEHAHLVADLRVMITHAGDLSNLILDPDLDSYYVMDATLLALPQMQERLAVAMNRGTTLLAKPALSAHDRHAFGVDATLLKEADMDRAVSSLEHALTEDANFYGDSPTLQERIPGALQTFRSASEEVIAMSERIASTESHGIEPAKFVDAARAARDASFALWRIAAAELDVLLDNRIAAFRERRMVSCVVAGLALLAAIGFVTFITRSISAPLRKQAAELQIANEQIKAEVAEQKRIEMALRAAEEKYRGIFENSVEGIFQSTPDGKYLVANPTLARIYGYESVEELQASVTDISARLYVGPQRREEFQRRIATEGTLHRFESQIYRKDGSVIWISEHARAVKDAAGKTLYYEGLVEDITARKSSEEQLHRLNKQLVEISRQAGMAEVATGVLHNVGNVLNSVNVATMLMTDRVTQSRVSHLSNVSGLLKEHASDLGEFITNDARGKKLPGFISTLAERLQVEQSELLRELEGLSRNVAHIKEIVAVQQNYARVSGVVETLAVSDLVEDALEMNDAAFDRHGVDVLREFEDVPLVRVDKHKVLQVLINVIGNAKYAVSESSRPDKQIVVRVTGDGERVAIAVSDNGVGIPKENLSRIFAHGFTTKENGHGFGLHSAALAATEIGGKLHVASDGLGHGATFTLEIPADRAARQNGAELVS